MIDILTKPFKYFFKLESASGLILLFAAVIALILSNSDIASTYFSVLQNVLRSDFSQWEYVILSDYNKGVLDLFAN